LLDVRIVAAANVLLAGEVDAGRFRADLFYRLCGSRVVLPPLRERREDIGLLAKHYATLAAHKRSLPISLSENALATLTDFHWPGNVRQLRMVVEGLVEEDDTGLVTPAAVRAALRGSSGAHIGGMALPSAVRESAGALALEALLIRCNWDTFEVARRLGVTRKTVYARIARFGIFIPEKYARRRSMTPSAAFTSERLACDHEQLVDGASRIASARGAPASAEAKLRLV
jgi:two-component system nitrogen regulation response regulator NtrX